MLLVNRLHVFAHFMLNLGRHMAVKELGTGRQIQNTATYTKTCISHCPLQTSFIILTLEIKLMFQILASTFYELAT